MRVQNELEIESLEDQMLRAINVTPANALLVESEVYDMLVALQVRLCVRACVCVRVCVCGGVMYRMCVPVWVCVCGGGDVEFK